MHENLIKWLNDEHMDKVWPTLTSLVEFTRAWCLCTGLDRQTGDLPTPFEYPGPSMSFSQPVPCTGSRTVFKESYDDTQCIVHCVRHAPDEQGHYPALACRSGRRCQRVGLVGIQRKMACGCRSSRTATTVAYLPACLLHGSYLNIQSARRTLP